LRSVPNGGFIPKCGAQEDECSQQIDCARQHSSQIVFNEYLAYMASPRNPWSWMKPGSSELYRGYETWYRSNQFK